MHECTHLCAHTHTLTQRGLVPLAVTLVLISKVYMCMNVHACAHTHDTHIHAHTHTHTHTLTDWACTTCSDFGLLFLTLYSQSMYMCTKTLAHCYVNSPYTIFVTNTYTHIHTHTHMCTHTRTCTHTDWACNACSDFGFFFLTLSLQSVHVHECTHTHIKPVARGGARGVRTNPPPPLKGSTSAYVVWVTACEASGASTQTPMGELTSLPHFS